MKIIKLSLSVFAGLTASYLMGQDSNVATHSLDISIPEVALVDIEGGASISYDLTANEAGNALASESSDSDLWLNYTSVVASGATNKITVQIDALVPGVEIGLDVAAYSGTSGEGIMGTAPGTTITLGTEAVDIITGIGSCYTGNGNANGHQLTYDISLASGDFGNIVGGSADISRTVTYTIVGE